MTLVREGAGSFYSTQGDDKCALDEVQQEPVDGHDGRYRLSGRGYCTQPARALGASDAGAVLVIAFRRRCPRRLPEGLEPMTARLVRTLPCCSRCCACVCRSRWAPRPPARVPLSAFPRERIAVETRASIRRHLFEAWRADSPQTREQGLMFVEDREMRPDQAMIFVYDPPQHVAMWMKNTLLPLDMLFVDPRGCIVTIKQNARPGSLATIVSRVPVVLVVELKAGTVAAQGMAIGDRVLRLDAGWPPTEQACPQSAG